MLFRSLPAAIEASGAFMFTPYHGTPLRDIAIQRGYIDPDTICSLNVTRGSILEMPQFPVEQIQGLCRVFSFYVKMPQERWDAIRAAESMDTSGEEAFVRLREEFERDYRPSKSSPKAATSYDLVIGKSDWDTHRQPDPTDYSDLHR